MNINECIAKPDSPIRSYWEYTAFQHVDICIVGAGIIGLSTALECRKRFPNASITILEKAPHGHGATTRNAGFACFGSATELLHDIDVFGSDHALNIAKERFLGLSSLLKRCAPDAIKYEPLGGAELIREHELQYLHRIDEVNAFAENITGDPQTYRIVSAQEQHAFGFSQAVQAVIVNTYEGQLHSGYLHATLESLARAEDIRIEHGSDVLHVNDIDEHGTLLVSSQHGEYTLHAQTIILCTNAMMSKLAPELDIKPGRGQVIVTSPIPDLPFQGAFHIDEGFYYFRSLGDRVLLGGGRNLDFEGEETFEFGHSDIIMEALETMLHEIILPKKEFCIDYAWSGLMGFTPDKKPRVSSLSHHVYCAFGCNGMGIALASRIAERIASLLEDS
ncbi:MAG: NAD(P)/FAD-dependent oxidoreductase [Ignavibacteria bacterium]|jgi:glycine/D-amino acid oxidase-like deaminating enzyme